MLKTNKNSQKGCENNLHLVYQQQNCKGVHPHDQNAVQGLVVMEIADFESEVGFQYLIYGGF